MPAEAYIHFVGVSPEHRGEGIGRTLYERFFDEVREQGRSVVRCVTSPANEGSVAFHEALGFEVDRVVPDYDGPGEDRVLLVRALEPPSAGDLDGNAARRRRASAFRPDGSVGLGADRLRARPPEALPGPVARALRREAAQRPTPAPSGAGGAAAGAPDAAVEAGIIDVGRSSATRRRPSPGRCIESADRDHDGEDEPT